MSDVSDAPRLRLVEVRLYERDIRFRLPFKFGATVDSRQGRNTVLLGIGLGLVLLASLLTYSRGGLAMVILAAGVSMAGLTYLRSIGRRAVIGRAGP